MVNVIMLPWLFPRVIHLTFDRRPEALQLRQTVDGDQVVGKSDIAATGLRWERLISPKPWQPLGSPDLHRASPPTQVVLVAIACGQWAVLSQGTCTKLIWPGVRRYYVDRPELMRRNPWACPTPLYFAFYLSVTLRHYTSVSLYGTVRLFCS